MIGGGGYIAVEFAGIFSGLGVDTTIVYRGREVLSRFDMDLRRLFHAESDEQGRPHPLRRDLLEDREAAATAACARISRAARSRRPTRSCSPSAALPNVEGLGLEAVGVELNKTGAIQVDEYSRTSVDHIWAIGDVTDRLQLTPVAIHEAMCFVETVFRDRPTKPDHDKVATAVFSQPEIGTVGLTEDDARASAIATSTSTRPRSAR